MAGLQDEAILDVSARPAVVRAGQEIHGPDRVVERTGDHVQLELVAEGSGSLSLTGQNYQLAPGVLFAHDSGARPRIETNRRSSLAVSYVVLSGSTSARLLLEHGPAPGAVTLTSAPGELRDLFDELIKVLERKGPHAGRITELVFERLVLRAAETAVPHGFARGPAFATYLGCRRLIDERWAEFTTLEQIASECQVDPAYLCRLFRRFDDQTPYQYLLRSKIRHAAVRLVQKGVTVKQVAGELGFADPMHFSRVFSKIVGMPPTRFSAAQRRQALPPQINREPRGWAPGTAVVG
jgi:AraC-like DNA-binding protein